MRVKVKVRVRVRSEGGSESGRCGAMR